MALFVQAPPAVEGLALSPHPLPIFPRPPFDAEKCALISFTCPPCVVPGIVFPRSRWSGRNTPQYPDHCCESHSTEVAASTYSISKLLFLSMPCRKKRLLSTVLTPRGLFALQAVSGRAAVQHPSCFIFWVGWEFLSASVKDDSCLTRSWHTPRPLPGRSCVGWLLPLKLVWRDAHTGLLAVFGDAHDYFLLSAHIPKTSHLQ